MCGVNEMYAMVFMMIFGGTILLAAGALALSKDPRDSVLMARAYEIKSKSLEEAKIHARKVAKILAIVGVCMIAAFGIGLIICLFLPD